MVQKGIVLFQILLASIVFTTVMTVRAADPVPATKPAPKNTQVTGIKQLDDAINTLSPWSVLPYWYGYPWIKKAAFPKETQDKWTAGLLKDLQDSRTLIESNPEDIALFCPNYPRLNKDERAMFWLKFISVLSELESGYKPAATYADTSVGPGVMSVGLLSLSLGDCDGLDSNADLTDWSKNLHCGVQMMSKLMDANHVIAWNSGDKEDGTWEGLARYWGPLRDPRLKTDAGRVEIAKSIIAKLPAWQIEAQAKLHPAYSDEQYRNAKEPKFEKILRLMNEMPFCN